MKHYTSGINNKKAILKNMNIKRRNSRLIYYNF